MKYCEIHSQFPMAHQHMNCLAIKRIDQMMEAENCLLIASDLEPEEVNALKQKEIRENGGTLLADFLDCMKSNGHEKKI